MLDWQIEAVRNAFAGATWETVVEERKRYTKRTGTVAEEMRELLQNILEEKLAQDSEPSPAEWSKSQEPKKRPLTAAEKKQREEARLERETQGGRFLPRSKEPESLTQTEYKQWQNLIRGTQFKRDPRSCTTCTPQKRGPDCGGQCNVSGFWQGVTMTPAEVRAYDASRGGKSSD